MGLAHFEMTTKSGWRLRSTPLSPDAALDLLPYVLVAAAPIMGGQVDLASLIASEKVTNRVDPVQDARDVVAGIGRVLEGVGQALLRPDARGGLRALSTAFREVTTLRNKEGQYKPLDDTTYAGVFTGCVPDLMQWIQGNVGLNYSDFLSIAPSVPKTSANPTE